MLQRWMDSNHSTIIPLSRMACHPTPTRLHYNYLIIGEFETEYVEASWVGIPFSIVVSYIYGGVACRAGTFALDAVYKNFPGYSKE